MWAWSYLWGSTCHETHTVIDGIVCESIIAETNVVPPQQSLTIVVPGRIHALMMTSNVSVEQSATGIPSPIPAWHQQPTLSRATGRNYTFAEISILYFHNIATPANHHKKSVKNKSKWSSTLVCSKTVTSQRQFRVQNGVPHEIGGSENGALLGTWAQTVAEPTETIRDIHLQWLARKPPFL